MTEEKIKDYATTYLGQPVSGPIDAVECVPWSGSDVTVTLDCAEFTTICPVTGQPDFGRLRITYRPADKLIETKSLKLFLQGYRDKKAFNEAIVDELADKLFAQAAPAWLTVEGFYNARGGSSVTCRAHRGGSD